jgi:hypothetical protein
MDDQAWDDADVERFLARLGECGIRPFLIEGSEREDPKDAVDFDPTARASIRRSRSYSSDTGATLHAGCAG